MKSFPQAKILHESVHLFNFSTAPHSAEEGEIQQKDMCDKSWLVTQTPVTKTPGSCTST